MTQELTEARIAEARDTPIFTVVQQAGPPLDRTFPHRTRITLLGAMLGGLLSAIGIILRHSAGQARAADPAGFEALLKSLPFRGKRRAPHTL
jgi:uncharacterized protein involved in exopolysaccharide biosynthesis